MKLYGIYKLILHGFLLQVPDGLARFIGQMIMVGFEGLTVTPEIRMMIEKYYVGNILLTRRNIRG